MVTSQKMKLFSISRKCVMMTMVLITLDMKEEIVLAMIRKVLIILEKDQINLRHHNNRSLMITPNMRERLKILLMNLISTKMAKFLLKNLLPF